MVASRWYVSKIINRVLAPSVFLALSVLLTSSLLQPAFANTPNPSGLTATTISTTKIDLTWSAGTGDTPHVENIYRCAGVACDPVVDGIIIVTDPAGMPVLNSYSDTGLTPSTTYGYKVVSTHVAGTGSTSTAYATTLSPPIVCDEGYELVDGECVLIPIECDDGYEQIGTECVLIPIECDEGYEQVGTECVLIPIVCDEGYELIDGECVLIPIVCDEGFELVDGVCVEVPEPVFNFLAGALNGGSGGPDHLPPSLTRPTSSGVQFDPFTPIEPGTVGPDGSTQQEPFRIGQNTYRIYGFSNTIEPNQMNTGQFTDMSLAFEEASRVEHVAVYFVDQDRDEHSDTDPALIFDKGNIIKVDPQGIFGDDIQLSTSKEGTKSIFNFGMSFDKPTNKHIIIVAWDDKRNVGTTKVFNALAVVGNVIPDQVAHFMPIEELGEFDLIKGDNGQYVVSQPIETEIVTNSPQTIAYPEFIGRMERHDATSLYDVINHEQQKAADIVSSMNVDNNLFATKENTKLIDHSKRAPQLSFCGKYLGCELDRENNDMMKTLMWEEHLKAEKTLKVYLEQRNHRE